MIEHHDFEAVTEEIWSHLVTWYGCDINIERLIKYDNESDACILDLYPEQEEDEQQEIRASSSIQLNKA